MKYYLKPVVRTQILAIRTHGFGPGYNLEKIDIDWWILTKFLTRYGLDEMCFLVKLKGLADDDVGSLVTTATILSDEGWSTSLSMMMRFSDLLISLRASSFTSQLSSCWSPAPVDSVCFCCVFWFRIFTSASLNHNKSYFHNSILSRLNLLFLTILKLNSLKKRNQFFLF